MNIGKALGFCCLLLTAIPHTVSSQIVLGTEDQPEIGRTFFIHNVEKIPSGLDLQFGESNFNLVLSGLETQSVDTARFVKPETRPEGADFPNSHLAVAITGKDVKTTNYLRREGGQTFITGVYDDVFGDGSFTPFQLEPEGLYFKTPLTVDDSLNDFHGIEHTFVRPKAFPGVDTFILKSISITKAAVDGYGTIQLPGLKAIEVLRVKFTRSQYDTGRVYISALKQWDENTNQTTEYGYSYLAKGQGHSLLDVVTSKSGNVIRLSYLENPVNSSVGSRPADVSSVNVYPNPVRDRLYFEGVQGRYKTTVNVYNPAGTKVLSTILNGEKSINVSELEPGLYIVQTTSNDSLRTASFVKE